MWSIPWLSAGTRLSFFSFEPRRSVADIRCLNWELDSEFCPTKNAFSSIFIRDDATIEFEEYTDDVDDTYEDDSDEYNDEYSSSEEEEEEEEDHTQDIEQELRKVLESSLGANSMIRRNYTSGYTDRTNGEAKYISFFPFSFTNSHKRLWLGLLFSYFVNPTMKMYGSPFISSLNASFIHQLIQTVIVFKTNSVID